MIDTKRLSKNREELAVRQNQLAGAKINIRRLEQDVLSLVKKIDELQKEQKEILKGK